jgi:cellulose biosynthesis protein BcsQ
MGPSILGEVGEYVREVVKLFSASPPDVVAVVIAGSAMLGFATALLWKKLTAKTPASTGSGAPLPKSSPGESQAKIEALQSKLARYSNVVAELEKDDADLWRLHPPKPPAQLAERLKASRTKIVLVGHLKGGVSKTTLLANLAAYFDRKGKTVLAIDFDYQGSLTATLIRANKQDVSGPYSDILLTGKLKPSDLIAYAKPLHPLLPRTKLVPAAYTLVQKENQAMIQWLLDGAEADVRYNLAELLLSPEVQNAFQVVLIDMGPRLTTASICALSAATHLLVPTILDPLSAEAVGSFLSQVQDLTTELKTGLAKVSVVGTMTRTQEISGVNESAIATITKALNKWAGDAQMLSRNIPFKQVFIDCAGTGIASMQDKTVAQFFDELGDEISGRIGL